MDALVLAIAALILSRLVRPETFEPYRRPVIGALQSATDKLPNSLRLPIMVGGAVVFSAVVAFLPVIGPLVTFAALLLILGYGRVTEDALAILTELRGGSFSQAQAYLTHFSGVDADQLDENGVARVAVETQTLRLFTEVFSPLALFALGGLPGMLLLWTSRMIAERDGSGETSQRWVSLLNWVPLRLYALTVGIMGDRERSRSIWKHHAREFSDGEIGILIAATAGALRIRLGGSRCIKGVMIREPSIGDGDECARYHIEEMVALGQRSLLLWAVGGLLIIAL